MSARISRMEGAQPILSLVSILIVGVVIAVYVVEDESLRLPIILFSFFLGILIAAIELRLIVRRSKIQRQITRKPDLDDEETKARLARFVADLFEEDIPYDEIEKQKRDGLQQMEKQQDQYDEDQN